MWFFIRRRASARRKGLRTIGARTRRAEQWNQSPNQMAEEARCDMDPWESTVTAEDRASPMSWATVLRRRNSQPLGTRAHCGRSSDRAAAVSLATPISDSAGLLPNSL
jgi:hypothetical protein